MTVFEAIEIIKKYRGCRDMPDAECFAIDSCYLCKHYCSEGQRDEAIDTLIKAVKNRLG